MNKREEIELSSRLPLTPAAFHIALALSEGPRHGYGIMREIERMSEGAYELGSGTLYRTLQKMQVDGWVFETLERVSRDEEPRRIFELTELGARVVIAETGRLEKLVTIARASRLLRNRRERKHRHEKSH